MVHKYLLVTKYISIVCKSSLEMEKLIEEIRNFKKALLNHDLTLSLCFKINSAALNYNT